MAESNAYSNPQRVVNNQFEVFRKARMRQQQQFQSTLANIQRKNIQKRKAQEYRYQQNVIAKDKMENSLSGFSNTGYDVFDQNIKRFWDTKVDDYFEIKNGISTGKIDPVRGKAALQKINQQVMNYKQAVKPVLELATAYKDAMSLAPGVTGSVSSVTNPDLQNILAGIAQGGDVNLVDREGELFLYIPGNTPDSGSSIQVSDLLKAETTGTALTFIPKMDDLYKDSVDAVLKPSNPNSPYFTITTKPNEKDAENEDVFRTMSDDQQLALKYDMNRMNLYSEAVNNQKMMNPLWADIYSTEEEINSLPAGDDFKKVTINGKEFNIDDFKDTDWQVIPEEIYNNFPDAQYQADWLQAQKKFAQRLMVNKSANEVIKKQNYNTGTPQFVETRKKPKDKLTPYTAQTLKTRSEELTKIKTLSENLNSNADFVKALNQLAGKNAYKERNGMLFQGSSKLVFDFNDKRSIAYLLGEAAGIEKSVMAAALLPK